jgi:hypothetical protein
LLGAAFLIAACPHWKCGGEIQRDFGLRKFQQPKSFLKCDKLRMQDAIVVSENSEQ